MMCGLKRLPKHKLGLPEQPDPDFCTTPPRSTCGGGAMIADGTINVRGRAVLWQHMSR
jgi:hypothetical protein